MFYIALSLGIFPYIIFFLGLIGFLNKESVALMTLIYIGLNLFIFKDKIHRIFSNYKITIKFFLTFLVDNKFIIFILGLILIQASINLIGVLGPELAFDALWYHLTLPRIYLNYNKIFFIPGGLLYYSAMPKLTEMYYIVALVFQGEILAKFIHFIFGVLTVIALFLFSKRYFSNVISLIISLIFYSNLVVAWESITAYVDLTRTFYELMALWAFLIWSKDKIRNWLIIAGLMLGFAISTKLLAIGTIFIFSLLIIFRNLKIRNWLISILSDLSYFLISILFALIPWLIFSLANTGNPIYPIFGGYKIDMAQNLYSPIRFIQDIIGILLFAQDPISPIYFIIIPLIIFYIKKFKSDLKLIALYSLFALIIWYLTPRSGGGRFIMPYLPAFSILIGEVIRLSVNKESYKFIIISCVILISCISITYRVVANIKYIPVFLNIQNKSLFLADNLNFSYGDFYDIDGYFERTLNRQDKVLLYGFHNLYYIKFPFIDSSWVKKGDKYNYVAVQNSDLPMRFKDWDLIYSNKITKVSLYSKNKEFYSY